MKELLKYIPKEEGSKIKNQRIVYHFEGTEKPPL